jgi:Na+/H+ antiporter NhaC
MSETIGILSLAPPAVAIVLALFTRRVLPALFLGVIAAILVLNLGEPWATPFRALDYMTQVAANVDNLQLIAFSLLIGGLLQLIRDADGFTAFARMVESVRKNYGRGTAFGLTYALGIVMFLEGWSNLLVAGTTLSTLYDKLKISRERLAYFVHTIGLNVVAIVVLNGWGAYYVGLLSTQAVENPFQLIVGAIPYNFYTWACHIVVVITMLTGWSLGPIKRFEAAAQTREAPTASGGDAASKGKLIYMVAPLVVLIATMVTSMLITGGGDISKGAGTVSILYAVIAAILVLAVLLRIDRVFTLVEIEEKTIAGMREFFDIAILIVFAFSLGQLCRDMGTGVYISQLAQGALPLWMTPALVFLLGAVMSFATGTSYGTLAIMVPIVLPLAEVSGLSAPLLFGVCLSGALFGDNTSPISDTSIVTSVATGVPVIDHVRTQLPYALVSGFLALCGFVALGLAFAR